MLPSDDQRGAARVATVSALIVVASFVASKAARDAILLARFDIKTLPIFVAISAVAALPIILVAGRLMARFGPARLIPVLNVVSAAFAVGEWLLLHRYPRPVAVIAYFHFSTAGAVLVSGFWSIVNERFDVQSAKRHISRIGIGATLGGIFGGLVAERAAVYLEPDAILLVLAGLQLACAATLYLFAGVAHRRSSVARPAGTWRAFRVATRSPLLRGLGGIVVLGAVAAGIMDYVFKADIVHASSHDGLLRSLAMFYTVTSVITAIVQAIVCGPLITRLGVPRSVATLPITVTAFGLLSVALATPVTAAIARGAEAVTRNSTYRAGYELIYAPLLENDKRSTKVVLDVGADRIGDLLGAQLVTLLVYQLAQPRIGLLIAVVCVGALSVILALRLPRSYTTALEDSLLARAPEPPPAPPGPAVDAKPWITLSGLPTLGQAGEFGPLSLRYRDRKPPARPTKPSRGGASAPARRATAQGKPRSGDPTLDAILDLRSGDPARIQRALAAGLTAELAASAIDLVGRDDVAGAALAALTAAAPRCTGMLVDAVLDPSRDVTVRRRLPGVLLAGEPLLAAWGLWRALDDPSFDVRYRSGAVLSRLAAEGHLRGISTEDVFEAVRRELVADRGALANRRVLDDLPVTSGERSEADALSQHAGAGLEHVFTVLGLALPAEPLRIALHAVQTDDAELRGTALEYLESILPADVRAQLWPLLEGEPLPPTEVELPAAAAPVSHPTAPPVRAPRSNDEVIAALRLSYPTILDKLRQRVKPA
jgi:hypothetical protein